MFQLEKYKGSRSRFTCPKCGQRNIFARYIDENGNYIDERVGRCNRESNCGYHHTPKEYGVTSAPPVTAGAGCYKKPNGAYVTSGAKVTSVTSGASVTKVTNGAKFSNFQQSLHFDVIDNSFVVRSLAHTGQNRFLNYLLTFIDADLVEDMCKKYFIGSTKDGKTVYWQIDKDGNARTGKIISYLEQTGKRNKEINPTWIHYELKRHKLLPNNFQHRLCFFGEHLLRKNTQKPVAIVEAEKTAAIASIFIDKFIWLALGGKSYLKAEKLQTLGKRKIVLYPDADGFEVWNREAVTARELGLNVEVSEIIESAATVEDKKAGFDLADYLIKGELHAQKFNRYVDLYNAKIDWIISDKNLMDHFNDLYDERLAITETDILSDEQIRQIVEFI